MAINAFGTKIVRTLFTHAAMKLNLHSRFLLLFGTIFVLGGAAGYQFFVWYSDEVLTVLGQRFAERNVLYEKSKILGIVTREVTLAQKMASSPVLRDWVAAEDDPLRRQRAIAELEEKIISGEIAPPQTEAEYNDFVATVINK